MTEALELPKRRHGESPAEFTRRRVRTEPEFLAHIASNAWRTRNAKDGRLMAPMAEWRALSDETRAELIKAFRDELEAGWAGNS